MGLLDDAIREHLELKRMHGATDDEIARAEQEALAPARREPSAGAGVPPLEAVPGQTAAPEPEALEPPPPPPPGEETQAVPPPAEAEFAEAGEPPAYEDGAFEAQSFEGAAAAADEPVYADEYEAEPAADYDEEQFADQPPLQYADEEGDEDYLAPEPALGGPAVHPALESTEPIEPDELEEAPPPGTPKPHGDAMLEDEDFDPDEVPAEEQLGPPPADPYRARTSILDEPLGDEPPPADEEPPPAGAQPPAGEQDVLEETPEFLQETPEHDKLWFEQKPPRDFDFE